MFCSKCGSKAAADDNFCSRCGSPINRDRETEPESSKTDLHRLAPSQYVRQITGETGIPTGERRIVTTLFADLANSTAIAERLDPEDVTSLMNTAFKAMTEPVAKYEGTLARLMGDGVLALFGAPVAHEDDVVRACKAALQMIRNITSLSDRVTAEYGIDAFEVRVGISCGLAVVGEVGTADRAEYTAMGDSVNLAARLQAAAEPNSVLVDREVWRQASNRFETVDLGTMQFKGKSRPIPVFRILKAASSTVPKKLSRSPLVGREGDLGIISQLFSKLGRGSGGVLIISGNAGVGKSRLIESSRSFSPQGAAWIEVQCQAYQSVTGYGAARNLVQSLLGIESETPGETIAPVSREKLEARMALIRGKSPGPDSSDGQTDPALAYLLRTPLDKDQERMVAERGTAVLKQAVLASCRRLINQYLSLSPLILLIEDLHWMDAKSAEIIEGIASLTANLPCLLILTTRPGQDDEFDLADKLKKRSDIEFHQIDLQPLTTEACDQLIRNLLKGKAVPDGLSGRLSKVSEGNPFFVEEILRSLTEDDLAADGNFGSGSTADGLTIDIPHSIQAAILSRIDRLDSRPRKIIQTAAVMGRTISPEALCRIMGDSIDMGEMMRCLGDLHQRDFLRVTETSYVSSTRDRDFPDARSTVKIGKYSIPVQSAELAIPPAAVQHYAFNHALTVDIAYNSLLKSERKRLNALAGDALEAVYADRIDELIPTLAYHFERGDNPRKALEYLVRAGQNALAIYDVRRALKCFVRAESIAADNQVDLSTQQLSRPLTEGLADTYFAMRDFGKSLTYFDRAIENETGPTPKAVLLRKKGRLLFEWGRPEDARIAYETALETMKDDFSLRESGKIYTGLSLVYLQDNRSETALEIGSLALLMSEKSEDQIGIAQARNNLGIILFRDDRLDEAEEQFLAAQKILSDSSDTFGRAACDHNLGLLEHKRENFKSACELFLKAVKIFEDLDYRPALAKSLDNLSRVCQSMGDEAMARSRAEKLVALREEFNDFIETSFPEIWQSGEW